MAGYHKCEHCNEWHDCNKPSGGAGCLGFILMLCLFGLFMPYMLETFAQIGCDSGYSWAKPKFGCDSGRMIYNGNLEQRLKTLEDKQPKQ